MKTAYINSNSGKATAEVTVDSVLTDWKGSIYGFRGSVSVRTASLPYHETSGEFAVSVDNCEWIPDASGYLHQFLLLEAIIKLGV